MGETSKVVKIQNSVLRAESFLVICYYVDCWIYYHLADGIQQVQMNEDTSAIWQTTNYRRGHKTWTGRGIAHIFAVLSGRYRQRHPTLKYIFARYITNLPNVLLEVAGGFRPHIKEAFAGFWVGGLFINYFFCLFVVVVLYFVCLFCVLKLLLFFGVYLANSLTRLKICLLLHLYTMKYIFGCNDSEIDTFNERLYNI